MLGGTSVVGNFFCWGGPVPYLELFWVGPVKKHPVVWPKLFTSVLEEVESKSLHYLLKCHRSPDPFQSLCPVFKCYPAASFRRCTGTSPHGAEQKMFPRCVINCANCHLPCSAKLEPSNARPALVPTPIFQRSTGMHAVSTSSIGTDTGEPMIVSGVTGG